MGAHAPGGETRPRLAVAYGHRSLNAMRLCEGAPTLAISSCSFYATDASVSTGNFIVPGNAALRQTGGRHVLAAAERIRPALGSP